MPGTPEIHEEDLHLIGIFLDEGLAPWEVAQALDLSTATIYHVIDKFKVPTHGHYGRRWTPREVRILRWHYPYNRVGLIQSMTGRSPDAIRSKASNLGVKMRREYKNKIR